MQPPQLNAPFRATRMICRSHQTVLNVSTAFCARSLNWTALVRRNGPMDAVIPGCKPNSAAQLAQALSTHELGDGMASARATFLQDMKDTAAELHNTAIDFELATAFARPGAEVFVDCHSNTVSCSVPLAVEPPVSVLAVLPLTPEAQPSARLITSADANVAAVSSIVPQWREGLCVEELCEQTEQKLVEKAAADVGQRQQLLTAISSELGHTLEMDSQDWLHVACTRNNAVVIVTLTTSFPIVAPNIRIMSTRNTDAEGVTLSRAVQWPSQPHTPPLQAAKAVRAAVDAGIPQLTRSTKSAWNAR